MVKRNGRCYELAWRHVTDSGEGILIHVLVWNSKLEIMMGHALIETTTGFILEPESGHYFIKKTLYAKYKIRELQRYTPEKSRACALKYGTYGPWGKIQKEIGKVESEGLTRVRE